MNANANQIDDICACYSQGADAFRRGYPCLIPVSLSTIQQRRSWQDGWLDSSNEFSVQRANLNTRKRNFR